MLSAAEVAELFGVSRRWVYENAEALGAGRLGSGARPRLRFDPDEVAERIDGLAAGRCSPGIGSDARRLPNRLASCAEQSYRRRASKKTAGAARTRPPTRRRA